MTATSDPSLLLNCADDSGPPGQAPPAAQREVRFEHSRGLTPLLEQLCTTLLISTYQAGKVAAVGTSGGRLVPSFHNFDRPMGMALSGDRLAVAARNQIWILRNAAQIASRMEPAGQFGACYLTRASQVTGEIQAHELGWGGQQLWIVNTLFSCLCTLDGLHSFVPRWCPPFISRLAPEDRCHLNGLAMHEGQPKYVTAMAPSDTAGGWRPTKVTSGCLLDVATGESVARGFAMPHSPRVYRDQVWLLDSGRGRLVCVDPASGKVETVAECPGYTRGLTFAGDFAFVGLSKIRETSTFGGVPIAEDRARLKCGVAVVELSSGRIVSLFEFLSGVDEIFDVALVSGSRLTAVRGPFAREEGEATIWTVPGEAQDTSRLRLNDAGN